MNKILITGSCGFIFGNFIRKVIHDELPYTFVSIDRINANAANSMYWNKSHTFYPADIRDQHIIDTIFKFEQPDIVIHGAAESSVDALLTDPNSFVTSNVLGTQVIINSCLKYNVKKLVYISTDEVYGQLTSENEVSWKESDPLNPRNSYAATKAAGEMLVRAAHNAHGLTYNITRCCNNYGPRQTPDKLIPRAIKSILGGTKIPIYGQGLQIRDWVHVFDNCNAIMTVINSGKPNEIYNIAANQELSNIEVVQRLCSIMNKGHDLIEFVKDPRGNSHDFRYSCDSSKLKELGWNPEIKFKDGIKSCMKWYLNNEWFLR